MNDNRFTALHNPRRVWAISSIHGELEKLYAIHDAILERLSAGDRIVYLGNITGYGAKSRETVDEILTFRRLAMSQPGVHASDFVYLRGQQEDMMQRILEIPYTQNPELMLSKMLQNGLLATMESYNINTDDGMRACKEGVLALTRWTMKIRHQIRLNDGHDTLYSQHRRAAFSTKDGLKTLLFVNSGINVNLPLEEQGDSFWKKGEDFNSMASPYDPFAKVIRGYDPCHIGVRIGGATVSIDGGAGFGGALICANMDSQGHVQELLQA